MGNELQGQQKEQEVKKGEVKKGKESNPNVGASEVDNTPPSDSSKTGPGGDHDKGSGVKEKSETKDAKGVHDDTVTDKPEPISTLGKDLDETKAKNDTGVSDNLPISESPLQLESTKEHDVLQLSKKESDVPDPSIAKPTVALEENVKPKEEERSSMVNPEAIHTTEKVATEDEKLSNKQEITVVDPSISMSLPDPIKKELQVVEPKDSSTISKTDETKQELSKSTTKTDETPISQENGLKEKSFDEEPSADKSSATVLLNGLHHLVAEHTETKESDSSKGSEEIENKSTGENIVMNKTSAKESEVIENKNTAENTVMNMTIAALIPTPDVEKKLIMKKTENEESKSLSVENNSAPNDARSETEKLENASENIESVMNKKSSTEDMIDDELFTLSNETMLYPSMETERDVSTSSISKSQFFQDDQKETNSTKESVTTEIKVIEESVTLTPPEKAAYHAKVVPVQDSESDKNIILTSEQQDNTNADGEKDFSAPIASSEIGGKEDRSESLIIVDSKQNKQEDLVRDGSMESNPNVEHMLSLRSYQQTVAKKNLVIVNCPKPESWHEEENEDFKKPLLSPEMAISEANRESNAEADPKISVDRPESERTPLKNLMTEQPKSNERPASPKKSSSFKGKLSKSRLTACACFKPSE